MKTLGDRHHLPHIISHHIADFTRLLALCKDFYFCLIIIHKSLQFIISGFKMQSMLVRQLQDKLYLTEKNLLAFNDTLQFINE